MSLCLRIHAKSGRELWLTLAVIVAMLQPARPLRSQQPDAEPDAVSIEFVDTPLREVLRFFSNLSGQSIVAGQGLEATINARVEDQSWLGAMRLILHANGLVAEEVGDGVFRIDNETSRQRREAIEAILTQSYEVHFADLDELATAVGNLLSPRGHVSVSEAAHVLVVTDIARVHNEVRGLVASLDRLAPQVHIRARLVFVDRSGLDELGIAYDLRDRDESGLSTPPSEDGEAAVALRGASISALGNASARLPATTLQVLSSLVLGRHTLISFLEALQSHQLSEIEAVPSVTVRSNREATLQVGERTPLRVLDGSSFGGASRQGGAGSETGAATILPQATVRIEQTGIILRATPRVTQGDRIVLRLHAERSAPRLAPSDAGFVFTTQNASSEVVVRDGETVVIGGLTVREHHEVISGVPLLMHLPGLGRLFRSRRSEEVQRDLVILVTPTIVRGAEP